MNPVRRRRWLVGVLVGTGLVSGFIAWRSRPEPTRRTSTDADVLTQMQEKIDSLQEEVRRTQALAGAAVSAAASTGRATATAPASAGKPTASTEAAPTRRANLSEADLNQGFDRLLSSETTDPAWSKQAEALAREAIARVLPSRSQLRELECRSTICRGKVIYGDRKEYDEALAAIVGRPDGLKWRGGTSWSPLVERSDGRLEQDSYLFREGTDPAADMYREEEARLAAAGP